MRIEEKYKIAEVIAAEIIRLSNLEKIEYFPNVSRIEICVKDIIEHDRIDFFTGTMLNQILAELQNVQTVEDLSTKKYGIIFYNNIKRIYVPKNLRRKGKIKK